MLIDWFTVVAQMVNFLILVWLLKKFLYGRILAAIDEREAGIAKQLREAAEQERGAGEQRALFEAKLREFGEQREAMLEAAREEVDRKHAEMLEAARAEIQELEAKWREDLERERREFLAELRVRASKEVLALSGRLVASLAGAELQGSTVALFLEKLHTLGEQERLRLMEGELTVRSATELSSELQDRMQRELEAWLGAPVGLRFEVVPSLGLGIELRAGGWRVGWNSEGWLEALDEEFLAALH
jgi:F-type H+-transporting ATPase subunit b